MFGMSRTSPKRNVRKAHHSAKNNCGQPQKMEASDAGWRVAHDFNNLLTVINGYCAMALHKKEEVQPIRKNIEEIQKQPTRRFPDQPTIGLQPQTSASAARAATQ